MSIKTARGIFEAEADQGLVRVAQELVAKGRARWISDPYVRGTVGLVKVERGELTSNAYVVVYSDGDWESATELEELAYG